MSKPSQTILDLGRRVQALHRQAAKQYRPVVDDILRSDCRDTQHIKRALDGLLDFCGYEPVVELYRDLCRHLWFLDREAARFYIDAYLEQREESE
jgi:hypothetical protein